MIQSFSQGQICALSRDKSSNQLFKELVCKSNKCENEYNYQCGPLHCSSDETSCIKYFKNKISKQKEQMNDLIIIVNSICRTGKNCFKKSFIRIRSGTFIKILKPIDCSCDKKFGFQCGFDYCAINEHECNRFRKRVSLNGNIISHLKKFVIIFFLLLMKF